MTSRQLKIAETAYRRFKVWNGDYHHVRFRFRNRNHIKRDRGLMHVHVQNASGFNGTRRLTSSRAACGKWHSFEIGRRGLARDFLIDIEPLVLAGIIQVEFDGERLRLEKI